MLVLAEVGGVVVGGEAGALRPACRAGHVAGRQPDPGGGGGDGADLGGVVRVVAPLGLGQHVEGGREVAGQGSEAAVDHPPAVRVLRQGQVVAEGQAGPEVLGGLGQFVAFEVQLGQPDVQVGAAPQRTVLRHQLEPGGERALGGTQPPQTDLHVGQALRAAEDVGEVLGGLELGDGLGVALGGGVEVAQGPADQPGERGGGAATEVVVVGAERGRPLGVGRGGVQVGTRPGTWPPGPEGAPARCGRAPPSRPSGAPGRASPRRGRAARPPPRRRPPPCGRPPAPG